MFIVDKKLKFCGLESQSYYYPETPIWILVNIENPFNIYYRKEIIEVNGIALISSEKMDKLYFRFQGGDCVEIIVENFAFSKNLMNDVVNYVVNSDKIHYDTKIIIENLDWVNMWDY